MPRILLMTVLMLATLTVEAQKKKKQSPFNSTARDENSKFLDKQWWLGFKAGVNLTQARPDARYTVLTPTNYSATASEKKYDNFTRLGSHATLEVTFNF